ncbi:acyltransferase family protein [Amphritea balenae]|uniref:Acyltransferase n=1 Tax=Amphritea balenae TaxID=452629 RepID=A0A3P1SSL5_9GAMM|nr:acyltransferase family protein [Amphritea balenae]RRD00189.1 acyltransferase [Amphritea balenae]GGK77431.1 hypothetical protein GCM10007941_29440 [Amphritea balenae]
MFRKDINGLRAVAVIAVVVFHFNQNWLSGGFAGVDVFFVISGYLMTGIVINGVREKTFSLTDFYMARANRIVPALAIMCFVLFVFGWIYFPPLQYETISKHILGSISFFSNFLYWSEAGYFDRSSHGKWLLHTWSLSVEWQFYLLYPAFILFINRFLGFQSIKIFVLIVFAFSFIVSSVASHYWPSSAYYLLPTRAWEMLMGGLAYLFPLTMKEKSKCYFQLLGMLIIFISFYIFSKSSTWPGYLAMLPVFGTFLVVLSNRESNILLNNVAVQLIGKCSYSIYLWHWPIVVLFYTAGLDDVFYIFLGFGLAFLLGFLSYFYVESKIKHNKKATFSGLFTTTPVVMAFFVVVISVITFFESGLFSRPTISTELSNVLSKVKASPYRLKCNSDKNYNASTKGECKYFHEDISWATLGDSHTIELAYALAKKLDSKNRGVAHYSYSACIPSYNKGKDFSDCASWTNQSYSKIINNKSIENVLINYRYSYALFGEGSNSSDGGQEYSEGRRRLIIESLDELILDLSKVKKYVFVLKPIPELEFSVYDLLGRNNILGGSVNNVFGVGLSDYYNRNSYVLDHFEKTVYPKNVFFIDPVKSFCDLDVCYAVKNGVPLYFDDDHPSLRGAELLINEVIKTKLLMEKTVIGLQ